MVYATEVITEVKEVLCQGKTDIPLSSKGFKRADFLGQKLSHISIDVIISSPLQRALETANVIQKYVSTPLRVDERLRERSFGLLEGCASEEMYRFEREEESGDPKQDLKVEPTHEVRERLQSFFMDLWTEPSDKRYLLVSHGRLFHVLCRSLGQFPLGSQIANMELVSLSLEDGIVNSIKRVDF